MTGTQGTHRINFLKVDATLRLENECVYAKNGDASSKQLVPWETGDAKNTLVSNPLVKHGQNLSDAASMYVICVELRKILRPNALGMVLPR